MYYETENKKISKKLKNLSRDYWSMESGKFTYSVEELMDSDMESYQEMMEQLERIGSYEIKGKCNDCSRNRSWFASNREDYHKIITLLADENGHTCPECELYSLNPLMNLLCPRKF